jgi:uncharacterized protein (DUF885 family)
MGLQQVAEISSQIDAILRGQGYNRGSVGERLASLNQDPRQLYPETDAGRAELLASLNAGVKDMYARLPQAFATVPSAPLEIRRVPPEIQDGASNGYYRRASLDGSRPAIYFINLKDLGDWPKYTLPSLTYHEGVPGHHLQLSIAQLSTELPMLRRTAFYSAYGEGWALYSEQLADELGGYEGIQRAGYLQSFLFRAERLVIDTGMNHKRWSREQAIDHMMKTTGFAQGRVQREIERYCASPDRRAATRSGISPGFAHARKRRRRSGRSSTCASSTRCCATAQCRCRFSSGESANGRRRNWPAGPDPSPGSAVNPHQGGRLTPRTWKRLSFFADHIFG